MIKKKTQVKRKWRTIYFKDQNLWEKVERLAQADDRSVNYVIEKLVKEKL